jgi:glycine/D-amino acid oxidase-like deaminating enzyme
VTVGGGIAGLTAAYYLAKAGIPGPMAEIAQDGMRLHRELPSSASDAVSAQYIHKSVVG